MRTITSSFYVNPVLYVNNGFELVQQAIVFAQLWDGTTRSTMKSYIAEWEACLPMMVWKAASWSLAERTSHSWVFLLFFFDTPLYPLNPWFVKFNLKPKT